MQLFQLRRASDNDLDLTYQITKEAMCEYVVQTWGDWDEGKQLEMHREHFNPSTHRIIVSEGADVGLLATEEEGSHLWLVKLYLRRSSQRGGLVSPPQAGFC